MKELISLLETEGMEDASTVGGKIMHLFRTNRDARVAIAVERYAAICLAIQKAKNEAENGDRAVLEAAMNGSTATTIFINLGK